MGLWRVLLHWQKVLVSVQGFSVLSVIMVFPHIPITTFRILFVPSQSPLFNSRHPVRLGVQLVCNSASQPGLVCDFQQSQPCSYRRERTPLGDPDRAHRYLQIVQLEFKSLNSFFFSPTWCSNIRGNQPISLYSLVCQKCLKISYTQSPSSLLCKGLIA